MTKTTRACYTLEFKEEALRLMKGGERQAMVALYAEGADSAIERMEDLTFRRHAENCEKQPWATFTKCLKNGAVDPHCMHRDVKPKWAATSRARRNQPVRTICAMPSASAASVL